MFVWWLTIQGFEVFVVEDSGVVGRWFLGWGLGFAG